MKTRVFVTLAFFILTGLAAMAWAAGGQLADLTNMERLGMELYNDVDLSYNSSQSCRDCHDPLAGFADPTNLAYPDTNMVSTGADGISKGGRNAPTAAYAGFSPALQRKQGGYVGGLFWDGRADGSVLGDPLAEQAQGPPLNPVEMAMPDKQSVIDVILNSTYLNLWYRVFGNGSLDDVDDAYDNFGRAIAAYERSTDVTSFTSKYDVARNRFSETEKRGLTLFQDNCSACHTTTAEFGAPAPLLTSYAYVNIGVPTNPAVTTIPDLGLGLTVNNNSEDGKFKVPTLRNIAMTPPYSHNGYFATLEEMVKFINDSRDYTPDVNQNLDKRVGNLHLTTNEVDDIMAFLMTLTDDY